MKIYHIYNDQEEHRFVLIRKDGTETELDTFNSTDIFKLEDTFYLAFYYDTKVDSNGVCRKEYLLRRAMINEVL